MNSRQEEIEKLLERFYAASLSFEEMQSLYTYFLYTNPLPDKFKDEAPLLQELGIRYFCKQDSAALESKIDQWYEEENTTTRFVKIVSLSRAAMKRIAAAAACVAAIVIGFWAVSTDAVPTMPTTEVLQPILVAQAEAPAATSQTTAQQAARPTPQHTVAKAEASVADGQNTAADVPTHNRTDHDAALPNTDTVVAIYDEPANTPNYRYLAYADIQSYKTDDKAYFCSTNCNAECVVNTFNKTINYI